MNSNLKKVFFLNKSWPVRIWMWSAITCVLFYMAKYSIDKVPAPTEWDMILMAYGLGSIAIYVLINGFDWA